MLLNYIQLAQMNIMQAQRMLNRYPGRVPVIVFKSNSSKLPKLDKEKYIVSENMTIGQFSYIISRRLKLKPEQSMFLFVNEYLIPVSATMHDVYAQYKKSDLFLYMIYTEMETFG